MKAFILSLLLVSPLFAAPMKPSPKRFFVGCRLSPGECKMSCGERNGKAEIDARLCDPASYHDRFACYCPILSRRLSR